MWQFLQTAFSGHFDILSLQVHKPVLGMLFTCCDGYKIFLLRTILPKQSKQQIRQQNNQKAIIIKYSNQNRLSFKSSHKQMTSTSTVMLTQIGLQHKPSRPILDPQLKNQLMTELSPQDLGKIKKGFDLYKGKVSQKQFICIMIDALYGRKFEVKHYEKEILTFIELFLLIDIKSLNKIKFEDFTNYLIDRQKSTGKTQECHFEQNQHLNRLEISAQKVFLLKNSPIIGILQNNKKNVLLLQKKTYKAAQNIGFGGVIINHVISIPISNKQSRRVYCISTNDKFLNFYDSAQNELIRRFILPDPIFYMMTRNNLQTNMKLIAGGTNGHLYQFQLRSILAIMNKKDKQAFKEEERRKLKYPSHEIYKSFMSNSKMVSVQPDLTCIDIIQPLDLFITGSNDSRVRLYDMRENGLQLAKQLDGHYKGIKGVAVSLTHKVIISCSFDFDLLVWNAYLQHPVARLQGHEAPLVNVCCPNKHDIIISLDSRSIMKIWNCQNYQLIQNVVIFENFPLNTSINFLYKNETDVAIVYTKKLKFFQYIVSYNPRLTDDYDITSIKYSPKNLQIYIGSKRSIKVWSIQKGIQSRTYNQVIQAEIAVIEMDARQRRLFVGSIDGDVVAVDVFSGLTIASYSKHSQEISLLIYNQQNQLLITGGWEKKLKIHNDTQHLERIESRENVLRNINNVSEKDLAGGSFSEAEMFLATHSKTNYCRIWDFEKGFLQAQLNVPHQIIQTHFLSPYPLLVVTDSKGSIYIFSTKHCLNGKPFSLLTQWKNMYSIQKTSQITFISYKKVQKQDWLILGDEYGYVRIVDLTEFIKQHQIRPVTAQMLGNKNPYRIQDYNYLGISQTSVNVHDFSHHESKVIVPPESIRQKLQIKAHNERINYISLVNESQEQLLLTAGSDRLVKLWNYQGQPRGALKQGLKENPTWQYTLNEKWLNKQLIQYKSIKPQLQSAYDQYMMKKRLAVIPFTEDDTLEQVSNDQIFRDLKEVDGYLSKKQAYKGTNKKSKLY